MQASSPQLPASGSNESCEAASAPLMGYFTGAPSVLRLTLRLASTPVGTLVFYSQTELMFWKASDPPTAPYSDSEASLLELLARATDPLTAVLWAATVKARLLEVHGALKEQELTDSTFAAAASLHNGPVAEL